MSEPRVNGLTFYEWCDRLNAISAAHPGRLVAPVVYPGAEDWRAEWEDGATPAEAWEADGNGNPSEPSSR